MTIMMMDAGGTISSLPNAQGTLAGGEEGLAGVLGVASVRQIYAGLSEQMTLADMARVRDAVLAGLAQDDVSGVIVAHGTDAMEETAYLTDLSLGADHKPVIFTGAMLPMVAQGSDGPRNLSDALAAAGSAEMAGKGALVAFAGKLIAASAVYKHSSHELDGFGWRVGDAGSVFHRPPALPTVVPDGACPIVALSGGDDGAMLEAALDRGVCGLVLMALGRGNGSAGAVAAVARATAMGVPVVIASRCPTGGTAGDYATGQALADAGGIFSGDLGATQARILLACLLGMGASRERIADEVALRGQVLAR